MRVSNEPALSCHPCTIRIGRTFSGPYHFPATWPHGTSIRISFGCNENLIFKLVKSIFVQADKILILSIKYLMSKFYIHCFFHISLSKYFKFLSHVNCNVMIIIFSRITNQSLWCLKIVLWPENSRLLRSLKYELPAQCRKYSLEISRSSCLWNVFQVHLISSKEISVNFSMKTSWYTAYTNCSQWIDFHKWTWSQFHTTYRAKVN